MFNHSQDFGERILLSQQSNRLGVPGFEKFLFLLLAVFSLFWIFYLRHFAPHAFNVDETRTFAIELRRYKADPVPILRQSVEPDSAKPDMPLPEVEQSPAATEKPEQGEQPVSKNQTQTQLLKQALELYRAENSEPIEIPDPNAEKHRPDNVFDPRFADRIGEIRGKNYRHYQAENRHKGAETYFDNMGVLNYRKGNTCFQLIEIPGIGYQWYAGKCAITHYGLEFELNGKRY